MRQLHVVAVSEDGRFVLLATSRNGTTAAFRVPLDDRLAAAVRGDLPRPGQTAPPTSSVSVREIQARLRAGETVEQIARDAGVPVSRVERFAGPVLSERIRIIEAARTAVLARPRRGPSALPLGEAVDAHIAQVAGVDDGSVQWSSSRRDDGRWLVEVAYSARARRKRAGWLFDPSGREVTAVDATSSVLGFVEPEASGRADRVVTAGAAGTSRSATGRRSGTGRRATVTTRLPAAVTRTAVTGPRGTGPAGTPKAGTGAAGTPKAGTAKAGTPKAGTAKAGTAEIGTVATRGAAVPPAASAGPTGRAPARRSSPTTAAGPAARRSASASPRRASTAQQPTRQVSARPRRAPVTQQPTRAPGAPLRVPAAARSGVVLPSAARRTAGRTAARAAGPTSAPDAGQVAPAQDQPTSPPQLRVVPDPDPRPRRATVPAWADVLLSTTPPARPAAPHAAAADGAPSAAAEVAPAVAPKAASDIPPQAEPQADA